jgi:Tat protein translocase TatB subunit
MDFLGIGPWELLLVLILALIFLGPGKITEIARTLGRTVRAIRKASSDLTATVTRELEVKENEPPASHDKTGEALSAINKAIIPSQDDQPTKPGEASAKK